ncbi:hypothetical protein EDC01DRAFT_634970 [Geopyxis carbonaria]|nr:hypothetical protein EDC01DRAFT_634970 [Geopyxis carbonaria]
MQPSPPCLRLELSISPNIMAFDAGFGAAMQLPFVVQRPPHPLYDPRKPDSSITSDGTPNWEQLHKHPDLFYNRPPVITVRPEPAADERGMTADRQRALSGIDRGFLEGGTVGAPRMDLFGGYRSEWVEDVVVMNELAKMNAELEMTLNRINRKQYNTFHGKEIENSQGAGILLEQFLRSNDIPDFFFDTIIFTLPAEDNGQEEQTESEVVSEVLYSGGEHAEIISKELNRGEEPGIDISLEVTSKVNGDMGLNDQEMAEFDAELGDLLELIFREEDEGAEMPLYSTSDGDKDIHELKKRTDNLENIPIFPNKLASKSSSSRLGLKSDHQLEAGETIIADNHPLLRLQRSPEEEYEDADMIMVMEVDIMDGVLDSRSFGMRKSLLSNSYAHTENTSHMGLGRSGEFWPGGVHWDTA